MPRARKTAGEPAKPFTLPHFLAWAAKLITDSEEPFKLEPFQEAFIADLFAGFKEAWLIVPEGNGKTTLLAAIALYHCEFRPRASVPWAASSRQQAELGYKQAEAFVLNTPSLHDIVHSEVQEAKGKRKTDVPRFTCLEGYRRVIHANGSRLQVFAADDSTGDGIIPTLGIIDELHRHKDLSLYRTWSGKLLKRQGQLCTISTAGEMGSDFEETRRRVHETAQETTDRAFTRSVTDRLVMHDWALPETDDPSDLEAVKRSNPFSAITVDTLREKFEAPAMTLNHWMRMTCNRPIQDSESWLGGDGPKLWESLLDPWDFVDGAVTYVGVDVALKHDTTAVVAVQKRPDDRYHAKCRIWYPADMRPIDVTDVMQYIRELDKKYKVEAIAFDPRFFDVPAKMLEDEGLRVIEVPQDIDRMTPAYGSLYETIERKGLSHDDDRPFAIQVLSGVARYTDRGFTLAKSKSRGKIDAAVALALAVDQAIRSDAPDVGFIAFD